jgi:glycosyltransferase involved in cell wall biosynthesis
VLTEKTSIIVIAYNEQQHIGGCMKAILDQTITDFTLIMVDDGSTDNTWSIMNSMQDPRISRVRLKSRSGYATARNAGLKLVKEGIVFFTDADCRPSSDWLEKGIAAFQGEDVVGVGGTTKYVAGNQRFTPNNLLSFSLFTQPDFHGCNVAYRAQLLSKIEGFRERYNDGLEDMDLHIRARMAAKGKFICSEKMIVSHLKKDYSLHRILLWLRRTKQLVYIIKDYNKDFEKLGGISIFRKERRTKFIHWFFAKARFFWIIRPFYLLITVFPPLLYFYFKWNNIKIVRFKDIAYIPLVYGYMLLLRIVIWSTAIKERFFII